MEAGEHYSQNLRRFYQGRLDADEMPHIERYVADGVARHQQQTVPYEFRHYGRWLRVASLPLPGVGRMRIWKRVVPPQDGEVLARQMARGGKETAIAGIDDLADGLMVRDASGHIRLVNQLFGQMYGLASEAMAVGQSFPEVLAQLWDGQPGAEEALLAWRDNAKFAGAPFELPLPGDRWTRVSEHRALDGSAISTHVDITHLRRLQRASAEAQAKAEALAASLRAEIEERERAEAALRQAQRVEAVGELTAGVAHDFNNLFGVISANLELLAPAETDPARQRRLAVMQAALARGAALTSQLQAFARSQPLQPQAVPLGALVAAMLPLLRSACGGGVEIVLDLPESLPAALVDRTQLEMVILNLTLNARDAMPAGGRLMVAGGVQRLAPSDAPEAPEAGEYVVLRLSDTGTGMSEAVLARAVEPFFTTTGPGKGSGLGLSQAYGVARQSGGAVRITSREGQGTTVSVLLPAVPRPAASQPVVPAASPGGKLRVLLVDDEDMLLEAMSDILDMLGHAVTAMPGGQAAQQALADGLVVDMLVTDVRMPGLDGPALATWARARQPGLPVLFVSGYAAPEALQAMVPGSRLLTKPCSVQDLKAAMAAVLTVG